jgi:hypothetical protein
MGNGRRWNREVIPVWAGENLSRTDPAQVSKGHRIGPPHHSYDQIPGTSPLPSGASITSASDS